jgi:hypothetical protein
VWHGKIDGMEINNGTLEVLKAGVASRLHIPREKVLADYYPSTYVGAPAGIMDESACVYIRARLHPENIGCTISASMVNDLPITKVANKAAELLQPLM